MIQFLILRQCRSIIIVSIICLALFPTVGFAAELYLELSEGEYQSGDTFIVDVRLDTQQEYINAVEVGLVFPKDILEVKDFSSGNSILTLWIEEPTFSNQEGKISFIGGIPGSYSGKAGLLGKIILKVKEASEEKKAEVKFLDNSKVLLNDKKGTKANLASRGTSFKILPGTLKIVENEWQKEIEKDKIPPEPFEIEISQDPLIFDGKYFVAFFTTDKQTGIDYYEIKEGKNNWGIAKSPYLLKNQSLGERIKVKAIDKAGNERIKMIKPGSIEIEKKIRWKDILPWIILIIIGIGIIGWIIRKLKIKNVRFRRIR